MAEIIVYSSALGDVDRQMVELYLQDTYAIPKPSTTVLLVPGGMILLFVWRRKSA